MWTTLGLNVSFPFLVGTKRTHAFMSVVVRFRHAHITYRNVNRSFHRTMRISHCGKVYSSISASIPTGTVSTSLSLPHFRSLPVRSLLPLETWWCHRCFFQESLFEWQWFSSEVVISLNMSHATSRDPFQQIKMCRNCQGSKYFHNFIFVLKQTQLDTLKQSIYVALHM